jgi:class 3 adenylate cyclase
MKLRLWSEKTKDVDRNGGDSMNDDDDDSLSLGDSSGEDEESSVEFHTSTHGSDSGKKSATSEESSTNRIAHSETKAVTRSKILFLLIIAAAAAGVGTATFFFTRNKQKDEFRAEFNNFAKQLIDESENNARSVFGQLHILSTTLSTFATDTNQTWPNMTLTHFAVRAAEIREFTGVELVVLAPLVHVDEKEEWERYAWEHQKEAFENDHIYYLGSENQTEQDIGTITTAIYPFPTSTRQLSGDVHRRRVQDQDHGDHDVPRENNRAGLPAGVSVPVWQFGPRVRVASLALLDLYSYPPFEIIVNNVFDSNQALLSGIINLDVLERYVDLGENDQSKLRSVLAQPVFKSLHDRNLEVVGFLFGVLRWQDLFENILPQGVDGLVVNMKDSCGAGFSFEINGREALFTEDDRTLDSLYNDMVIRAPFARFATVEEDDKTNKGCTYELEIYPSQKFEATFESNEPWLFTSVVVLVFLFTAVAFMIYDVMVQRRQDKVMNTAKRTRDIVTSLFPKDVGLKLIEDAQAQAALEANAKRGHLSSKASLKSYLDGTGDHMQENSKPLADLFPATTVAFGDIVGFTAWSSTREPSQVFTLLETIYREFDDIAKRRRVFKVETVGDCYVAVCGLPDPRKDHYVVMARFARDCLQRMQVVLKRLEVQLGPDTAELGMRFGLHSGPVTAGVLRGDKARFQLFGDTVNMTARIESTGQKDRIHLSQDTADLLVASGRSHWVHAREETVHAKGKGEIQTFWLEIKGEPTKSTTSASTNSDDQNAPSDPKSAFSASVPRTATEERHARLVDWNVDLLQRLLREIIAQRQAIGTEVDSSETIRLLEQAIASDSKIVLDEVKDVVALPKYNSKIAQKWSKQDSVQLDDKIVGQLRDYIRTIAALYRDNPFHNFEHASHVTMSVVKLLSRIVAPDLNIVEDDCDTNKSLHDHTYGITSDPLTQFAVVLSALLHDVDHTGVPNAQLVKEESGIAAVYRKKSVAEQNSVDISWNLLQEEVYTDLRRCIYGNGQELQRFRQLVVNTVMATDIMDKELSADRKSRWNIAFAQGEVGSFPLHENVWTSVNRKATIVIEHLIQASDVAHTMQHWHIYRKWNAKLFEECYAAYKDGRADNDPAEQWYEGEIGFFDYYIIPLAMKLKSCGVFGVSSDEYLNYARQNRKEWESKGREIVAELVESEKLRESMCHKNTGAQIDCQQ